MAKWEQRPVMIGGKTGTYVEPIPYAEGGRGGAPFEEYPKAMYRAESAMGGPRISGFREVRDEGAELLAKGQGWFVTQQEALADVPRQQREFARLAAERAANERWMSPAAQAEARAVDEATMEHVPVIPETPIRRGPGRPRSTEGA